MCAGTRRSTRFLAMCSGSVRTLNTGRVGSSSREDAADGRRDRRFAARPRPDVDLGAGQRAIAKGVKNQRRRRLAERVGDGRARDADDEVGAAARLDPAADGASPGR